MRNPAGWRSAGLLAASVVLAAAFDAGVPVRIGVPRPSGEGPNDQISFNAPFDLVNAFVGERFVEGWHTGGAAMVHRNFVRLTSDAQGHRGWLTNRALLSYASWSVLVKFRVSGQNSQLYGDGLAFWLVKAAEHVEGAVFGREDRWRGLGVFFDTFQNLDKSHHHKHPYVSAVVNDGTLHYEPVDSTLHTAANAKHVVPGREEGSGCSFDFRFSEARDDFSVLNGTWAHIVHDGERLKVAMRLDGSSEHWVECIDLEMGPLEGPHHVGLSAATGDLVDNHDVLALTVHGWDRAVEQAEIERIRTQGLALERQRSLDLPAASTPPATAENYLGIIDEQALEIERLRSTVAVLQHRIEYELSAVRKGLQHAKSVAEMGATRIDQLHHEVRRARGSLGGRGRACADAGEGRLRPSSPNRKTSSGARALPRTDPSHPRRAWGLRGSGSPWRLGSPAPRCSPCRGRGGLGWLRWEARSGLRARCVPLINTLSLLPSARRVLSHARAWLPLSPPPLRTLLPPMEPPQSARWSRGWRTGWTWSWTGG
jgi:hypothetical protein